MTKAVEVIMSCGTDFAPRQKNASTARSLFVWWCGAIDWLNDHFWVGSQSELAEKERYDALQEKDKQIVELRRLLAKEQQLTAELSEEICSLDNRLVTAELQLQESEGLVDGLRDDLAVLTAQRNSILGGRRRKCR